jgi:hypothetical protein
MSPQIVGISLVARPNCWYKDFWFSSIVSKREMVEFIWFICGSNRLGLKRYTCTYSYDLISIYVHVLCIFIRYSREQKRVFRTLKKRVTPSKREMVQFLHDESENERFLCENRIDHDIQVLEQRDRLDLGCDLSLRK